MFINFINRLFKSSLKPLNIFIKRFRSFCLLLQLFCFSHNILWVGLLGSGRDIMFWMKLIMFLHIVSKHLDLVWFIYRFWCIVLSLLGYILFSGFCCPIWTFGHSGGSWLSWRKCFCVPAKCYHWEFGVRKVFRWLVQRNGGVLEKVLWERMKVGCSLSIWWLSMEKSPGGRIGPCARLLHGLKWDWGICSAASEGKLWLLTLFPDQCGLAVLWKKGPPNIWEKLDIYLNLA